MNDISQEDKDRFHIDLGDTNVWIKRAGLEAKIQFEKDLVKLGMPGIIYRNTQLEQTQLLIEKEMLEEDIRGADLDYIIEVSKKLEVLNKKIEENNEYLRDFY